MSAPARTFTVRHIQLLRALFAAASALMITFSPDHSAAVGFAVFGGFVAASGFILILGAWVVASAGNRWPFILLAIIDLVAAVVSGIPTWRTDGAFFVALIIWGAASGAVELIAGIRARRADPTAKDAITVGALGILLAVLLLFIPWDYTLEYSIEGAGTMTLTGIILAVGLFGGYAAIVAVFLAIAGFSPKRPTPVGDANRDTNTKDADATAAGSESATSGGTA